MKRLSIWLVLPVILAVPSSAVGGETGASAAGVEFFEKKVRPVLIKHCSKCHLTPKKPKGKLALVSRAALLKGGETGPAIVPGKPDKSLLIAAISYKEKLRMPPRSKLSESQIADLTAWVKMGAPWPGGGPAVKVVAFDFEKRRKHWSFQPVRSVVPPAVTDAAWCRTPLDRFLLARLEAKKLRPAPAAGRRTLIRRVTFDLIGLPPTPAEIDHFLADKKPGAYERIVDRLLASPAYGERWGRHWLDLVRFAETSGHEFDFEIPHAAGYRDYTIRALNEDVPYDRFAIEHLAGDLLASPRRHTLTRANESIAGTGFWFLGESKHSPVDLRVDGADRRDNQIDVFGKAFLGLTISCARCHDHKFDPIYTKDYYSLASYLQSSRMQLAFTDHVDAIGIPAAKIAGMRQRVNALAIERSSALLLGRLKGLAAALEKPDAAMKRALPRDPLFTAWQTLGGAGTTFAMKKRDLAGQWRKTMKQMEDDERYELFEDFSDPKYRGWFATGHAFGAGPATSGDVELTGNLVRCIPTGAQSGSVSGKLQGALRSRTFTIDKKFIHYRASGNGIKINLIIDGFQKIQASIYGGLSFVLNNPAPGWRVQNVSMWVGLKAYIEVLDDGDGQVGLERIVFSDVANPPGVAPDKSLLGLLDDATVTTPAKLATAYAKLLTETARVWRAGKLNRERVPLLNALLASEALATRPGGKVADNGEMAKLLARVRQLESGLPTPRRALAMADGTGIRERVAIRGNPGTPGEEAPRRQPLILGEQPEEKAGSGRLALAKRLVAPTNPLVSRVIANRLWQHHFGQGLVRSPDDFGHQGEKPTHPELLDWLAKELVRSRWSLKHMHRLMVTGSAYRMRSRSDAKTERIDPRNELFHKMPIRRLEAEAIRDAMLSVSGRLDRRMFGRGPLPHLTEFMIGRGRPGSGPLDGDGRRSLYLNVRRNFLNPMFLAFDYPVPFTTIGRRSVSNVPAQALTLLNNPFVTQQARLWSERVAEEKDSAGRIKRMYRMAFGRDPSVAETKDALAFLKEQGNTKDAWADLAHVLFNVKEFIFVN